MFFSRVTHCFGLVTSERLESLYTRPALWLHGASQILLLSCHCIKMFASRICSQLKSLLNLNQCPTECFMMPLLFWFGSLQMWWVSKALHAACMHSQPDFFAFQGQRGKDVCWHSFNPYYETLQISFEKSSASRGLIWQPEAHFTLLRTPPGNSFIAVWWTETLMKNFCRPIMKHMAPIQTVFGEFAGCPRIQREFSAALLWRRRRHWFLCNLLSFF